MKIGILGTADIAFRRFLPALQKYPGATYAGVASRTPEKATHFVETYGGKVYPSYDALLADGTIDAVYVPLPPALHYEWGKKVLESGKHLFMEKPFSASLAETEELLRLATNNRLAVHENYMFLYHSQLGQIKEIIASGKIGELRLIQAAFGFPKRSKDDFRYNKALGGGALLDCGGYPVRLALDLLGNTAKLTQANLVQPKDYEVDLYGSAVLENNEGLSAQISFGMDNSYMCNLEVWGSTGRLTTQRIFTAPDGYQPEVEIQTQDGKEQIQLSADNSFLGSIEHFVELINLAKIGEIDQNILLQSALTDAIKKRGTSDSI